MMIMEWLMYSYGIMIMQMMIYLMVVLHSFHHINGIAYWNESYGVYILPAQFYGGTSSMVF